MKQPAPSAVEPIPPADLHDDVIGLFVQLARALNLPKSVGEIYGLLFMTPDPLSMDRIVRELGISVGSASQGLRLLRGFGAVRTIYIPGQRRDHYVAEVELRRLALGFLRERILPELKRGGERLESILARRHAAPDAFVTQRLERLRRWQSTAGNLLPVA